MIELSFFIAVKLTILKSTPSGDSLFMPNACVLCVLLNPFGMNQIGHNESKCGETVSKLTGHVIECQKSLEKGVKRLTLLKVTKQRK